jgi:DNA-binding Lrp family transcriptional regulator
MVGEDTQNIDSTRDYRELSRILSYECLLTLALLLRYRKLTKGRLADVLGLSAQETDERLRMLEGHGVVRRNGDFFEIRTKGRKIAKALELYKFEFARPEDSQAAHLSDSKRKRQLAVNDFYIPKDIDVS